MHKVMAEAIFEIVMAEAIFEIQIGNLKIKNKFFIIPDLSHTCILGHDFLTNYKVKISYEDNTVIINDQQSQVLINPITNNSKAGLAQAEKC